MKKSFPNACGCMQYEATSGIIETNYRLLKQENSRKNIRGKEAGMRGLVEVHTHYVRPYNLYPLTTCTPLQLVPLI